MIYQPSLFAHINSIYHAFKSEVLKDSHCETTQYGYNSDGVDTDKGYKENNFELHASSICTRDDLKVLILV